MTQLHMRKWRWWVKRSAERITQHPLPAAPPEVPAALRPEETQGMRLEREARDFELGQPLGEGGLEWQQR